jgi:hypothetical protein
MNEGIFVLFVLLLSVAGTCIRNLLRDKKRMKYENDTKEISIVGLKEIIRLLEKKEK